MFAAPLAIAIGTGASALTIAAAAMTAVGGLTGDKELSFIGSMFGMANGVFSGEGLAGMATDAADNVVAASSMGEVAGGAAAVADAADNLYSGAQTALAGGDVAGETLAQAGSVNPAASETAGIQAPAATSPAQASLNDRPWGVNKVLDSGETGAFDMGQFSPQDMGLTPASQAEPGLIDSVLNWGKNNQVLAGMGVKAGMELIGKGLSRDTAGQKIDMERQALAAKIAELDRAKAARAYVPGSIGMAPNPNANLYPNGYRPPLRGFIARQMK